MDDQDDAGRLAMLRLFDPQGSYSESERALHKLEPAWAKAALALRGGPRFGHEGEICPRWLPVLHAGLAVFQKRFEAGDTFALLQAVQVCAFENVPLPTWLATAYIDALQRFLKPGGAASLDSVFASASLPTDTPKKAAAARQDWELGTQIWGAAWQVAQNDVSLTSLDAALDAVLKPKRFGVAKTKARTLFNMVEKNQIEHLRAMGSNIQPLSRFLAKRRKEATS